ncbi:AzlC family ABC transporter permease [Clostridium sp. D33t1_170424_F3]|uniref:AzlC family ABC transporter permease n=1 Tax=Clostridium sp. D33t1_170424_F3 TaxID=2787099 RepID=UPI003369BE91
MRAGETKQKGVLKAACRAALPCTVPVMVGYLFLGAAFGILLESKGYGFGWAALMSFLVYAGSMQFVAVSLLVPGVRLIQVAFMTLMVNIRHIFYGISMLEKFQDMGRKKPYMIFSLTDETFSLLCSAQPPEGVDRNWFLFFISLFNQAYWVIGSIAGGLLGAAFTFNTQGIDFAMTALFVVIFVNQWREAKSHIPALAGLVCSVVCLLFFGPSNFILPSMIGMTVFLIGFRKRLDCGEEEEPIC